MATPPPYKGREGRDTCLGCHTTGKKKLSPLCPDCMKYWGLFPELLRASVVKICEEPLYKQSDDVIESVAEGVREAVSKLRAKNDGDVIVLTKLAAAQLSETIDDDLDRIDTILQRHDKDGTSHVPVQPEDTMELKRRIETLETEVRRLSQTVAILWELKLQNDKST